MTAPMSREAIAALLLDGDPAVRWPVLRDPAVRWPVLRDPADVPDHDVVAARAQVAVEGWGADLLARQDADGRWAAALYSPKWTSTTYTLLLLRFLDWRDARSRL